MLSLSCSPTHLTPGMLNLGMLVHHALNTPYPLLQEATALPLGLDAASGRWAQDLKPARPGQEAGWVPCCCVTLGRSGSFSGPWWKPDLSSPQSCRKMNGACAGRGQACGIPGNILVLNPPPSPPLGSPSVPLFYETPLGSGSPRPIGSLVGAIWSPHLDYPFSEGGTVDFR